MLAEERRELGRGNRRGADACHLIRRESHADTRAAYKHAVLSVSVSHRVGNFVGKVGVIDTIVGIGAKVENVLRKILCKIGSQELLLLESSMV